MSKVERVIALRTQEEIAERIEPLAQAMARLADDARAAWGELDQRHRESANQVIKAAQELAAAAREAREAASEMREAAQAETWKAWALVGVVTLACSSGAVIGFATWWHLYSPAGQEAQAWRDLAAGIDRQQGREKIWQNVQRLIQEGREK